MAKPLTIVVPGANGGRRYVSTNLIATLDTREEVSGDVDQNDRKAIAAVTVSFGGTNLTELYSYRAALDKTINVKSRARSDVEAREKIFAPLREKAQTLARSLNNFFHSDEEAPRVMSIDWFIASGKMEQYAGDEFDPTDKGETVH